jgi:putative copper resistance protein D
MIYLLGLVRGMHIAGYIVAFGTLLFSTFFAPVPRRLAWVGFFLALLSGVVWFVLQTAAFAAPTGWADEVAAFPIVATQTRFGMLLIVRMVLLFLALLLFHRGKRRRAVAIAGLGVLAEAWLGHGAAMLGGTDGNELFAASVVHLGAAGMWLGTLPALWLVLGFHPEPARLARRYSLLGMVCVAALLATAALNYLLLIGSVRALFTTAYGLTALAKIALFAALLALAARNKFGLTPLLPPSRPTLRRAVLLELALGFLLLLAAGVLLEQEPPTMANMAITAE